MTELKNPIEEIQEKIEEPLLPEPTDAHLHGIILDVIDEIRKQNRSNDYDTLMVIVGKERKGKSTLMLHLLELYDEKTPIAHVGLTARDFVMALNVAKHGNAIAFDEAGDGLMSQDTMTLFSRDLVRTYQVIGAMNYFTILVLPNFFMLNKYFRQHRVKFLIEVYARGYFSFYGEDEIKTIIRKGEKEQKLNVATPMFRGRFPRYTGKLLDEYMKKKKQKVDDSLQTLNELWGIQSKMTMTASCKQLGVSYPKLRELIDSGRIKSEIGINNKEYIEREQLMSLGILLRDEIKKQKEESRKQREEKQALRKQLKELAKKREEIQEAKKDEKQN